MRRMKTIVKSTNGDRMLAATMPSDETRSLQTEVAPIRDERPTYCGPRIELLVTPDCPYATLAKALITVTLTELGLSHTPVRTTVIDTTAEAIHRRFTGSPSIIINGVDPWALGATPTRNPPWPAVSSRPRPDFPPRTVSPKLYV
jgi:hypothetical protein